MNDQSQNKLPFTICGPLYNSNIIVKDLSLEEFEQLSFTQNDSEHALIIKKCRDINTTAEDRAKLKLQIPGLLVQCKVADKRLKSNIITDSWTGYILIEEDGKELEFYIDKNGKTQSRIKPFSSHEEALQKRAAVISEHFDYIKYAYDSVNKRNHYIVRVENLTVVNYIKAHNHICKIMGIMGDPYGINAVRLATLPYSPDHYYIGDDSTAKSIDCSVVNSKIEERFPVIVEKPEFTPRAEGQRFFTQSLADIHLKEFVEKNKERMIFYPEGYVICLDRLPMIKLFGRNTTICSGRNQTLFVEFSLYVSLNGFNQTEEQLYKGFSAYNQKWCQPALPEDELVTIFKKVINRYNTNQLEVGAPMKNGAFFSWCKLAGKEKMALASSSRFDRNMILWLERLKKENLSSSFSLKEIAKLTGISVKTMRSYIKKIKDVIQNGGVEKWQYGTYNLVLLLTKGLHHFTFFTPPLTIKKAISDLKLEGNVNLTKRMIAEKARCSESKVVKSDAWKNHKLEMQTLIRKPLTIQEEVNAICKSSTLLDKWYRDIRPEGKRFFNRERASGRTIEDIIQEMYGDGFRLKKEIRDEIEVEL